MGQKKLIGLFLPLFFGGACTKDGEPYPQVITRNQASYDFDCPSEQIKIAPLGNHRYVAEGCYKREIYVCSSGFFLPDSEIQCKQQITPLPQVEGSQEED